MPGTILLASGFGQRDLGSMSRDRAVPRNDPVRDPIPDDQGPALVAWAIKTLQPKRFVCRNDRRGNCLGPYCVRGK